MKCAVLFSGGKDSAYALMKALEKEEVVCLISILSKNKESYMFHTPNIEITKLQAKAANIPLLQKITEGKKELELSDLEDVIREAKEKFNIDAIVTGAIESVYQASRIEKICNKLSLWCFNPVWKKDQKELLDELIENKFEVIISGVFAYPFDKSWLGRKIDKKTISELMELNKKYEISPSGEGGEIETTVLDAPYFKKKIKIIDYKGSVKDNAGVLDIIDCKLVDK